MFPLNNILDGALFSGVRHLELDKLYRYYVGNQDRLCTEIFNTRPSSEIDASILDGYKVYVNLTAPSVNRIVSGVYGGVVNRTVESGSPYKKEIEEAISSSYGYGQTVRNWFQNSVLFGTGYLVWRVKNGQPKAYCPNPIFTEIEADPYDISEIISLREYSADGNRYWFVNREGYGTADKNDNILDFVPHGLGIVPVTISYGENLTSYGSIYGLSLVRDAVKYSQIISRLQLDMLELVKYYTAPQAVLTGELNMDTEGDDSGDGETEGELEAFKPGGILPLKEGGKFEYVSPQAQFNQILETIAHYKKQFCLSSGIPLDSLDSSNIDPNQSATAARLRAQPLQTALQRLTEEQKVNEIDAIQKLAAVIQWLETGESVTYSDITRNVKVSVSMEPAGTPESRTDEVTAWVQLYNSGTKTLEDMIRHFNGNLSESEIARRVSEIKNDVQKSILTTSDLSSNINQN